jgi:hypothetical protein
VVAARDVVVVGDVVAVGPLGWVVALTRVVVLACASPVVSVTVVVSLVLPGRRPVPVAPGDAEVLPLPGLPVDGAPSGAVVLVVDSTGPPDAASLVDVDAPDGGGSCTSPVGGGASVSKLRPSSSGEPQAAEVTTMSATSSFNVRIVAPSAAEVPGGSPDRDAHEENEARPPNTSRRE